MISLGDADYRDILSQMCRHAIATQKMQVQRHPTSRTAVVAGDNVSRLRHRVPERIDPDPVQPC